MPRRSEISRTAALDTVKRLGQQISIAIGEFTRSIPYRLLDGV